VGRDVIVDCDDMEARTLLEEINVSNGHVQ